MAHGAAAKNSKAMHRYSMVCVIIIQLLTADETTGWITTSFRILDIQTIQCSEAIDCFLLDNKRNFQFFFSFLYRRIRTKRNTCTCYSLATHPNRSLVATDPTYKHTNIAFTLYQSINFTPTGPCISRRSRSISTRRGGISASINMSTSICNESNSSQLWAQRAYSQWHTVAITRSSRILLWFVARTHFFHRFTENFRRWKMAATCVVQRLAVSGSTMRIANEAAPRDTWIAFDVIGK